MSALGTMLRQRPAGDKSWPIACSDTTLGTTGKDLDLSEAGLDEAAAEEEEECAECSVGEEGEGEGEKM